MRITHNFLTLCAFCALFLCATAAVEAQKKGKTITPAQLIGTWTVSDLIIKLKEDNATEEDKKDLALVESILPQMRDGMVGKATMTFKEDGTISRKNTKNEQNGTWKLTGNLLTIAIEDKEPETAEVALVGKLLDMKIGDKDKPLIMNLKMKK